MKPEEITNKEQAITCFRNLVRQYGLRWTAKVPGYAWDLIRKCNQFLDENDRRRAIGL